MIKHPYKVIRTFDPKNYTNKNWHTKLDSFTQNQSLFYKLVKNSKLKSGVIIFDESSAASGDETNQNQHVTNDCLLKSPLESFPGLNSKLFYCHSITFAQLNCQKSCIVLKICQKDTAMFKLV